MALDTYANLQTAIAGWLHRRDAATASQIPDFIALAETELNNELRLIRMETDNTLSLASGARTVALPTGFLEPISLELVISGTPNQNLTALYKRPQNMTDDATGSTGRPDYWTINGANIEFERRADQAYTLSFRQLTSYALSTLVTTNWLLTNYPNLYLFGSLIQSASFVKADDQSLMKWEKGYARALSLAKKKAGRTKSLQLLTTELPGVGRRENIITG